MRITIDGRMMDHTGIGRYVRSLISAMAAVDGGNTFAVVTNGVSGAASVSDNIEYITPRSPIPIYSFAEQLRLPYWLRRGSGGLVHYPSFNHPVIYPKRFVATVHDLIYYIDRKACPGALGRLYARVNFRSVALRARRILTGSEYVKGEIVRHLGVRPERVAVTYYGVDTAVFRPVTGMASLHGVRKKYGIEDEYVFYVGSHHPRKNLATLLEAFSGLRNRKNIQLVIGGRTDPRWEKLYYTADTPGLSGRVRFIGEVADEDLPALYTMARAFVFPSLAEGFGLPVLEAMACGTPVVASNTTSLPEVVGEAGLLVDPTDGGAWAEAIDGVLDDTALAEDFRKKGIYRAGIFNWEATARRTLRVYEEVLTR